LYKVVKQTFKSLRENICPSLDKCGCGNDEQIEQVSGGTVLEPRPDTPIKVGGVGDMKKDPA